MRYKDIIIIIIIIIIIPLLTGNRKQAVFAENYTKTGLIEKCSLSCVYIDGGKVKINAKTQAVANMSEIGFVDIKIQKSSDGDSWTDESVIGENIVKGKKFYSLSGFTADIEGGYYYRAVCTHYAKGLPFTGDEEQIQTAVLTSRYFWADKIYRQDSVSTTGVSIDGSLPSSADSSETTAVATSAISTAKTTDNTDITSLQEVSDTGTYSSTEILTVAGKISENQDNSPPTGVDVPYELVADGALFILTAIALHKRKYIK